MSHAVVDLVIVLALLVLAALAVVTRLRDRFDARRNELISRQLRGEPEADLAGSARR